MSDIEKKFQLYAITIRYIAYKVTENLRQIYLDVDLKNQRMLLTAFYKSAPSPLEIELFDDIITNTNAQIPDFFVDGNQKLCSEKKQDEKHDFVVFAFHEEL